MEEKSRVRTRNTKITRAVLTALLVAIAGALNPQALVRGVLKELKTPKHKRRNSQNAIYAARGRLARQGLIEYRDGFWKITEGGKRAIQILIPSTHKSKSRPRWDKKWRILIFDVREEKKVLREKIRATLSSIGFKRLQDSVWVYPYNCEDLIALLKADFEVGEELLYIIADEIENDWRLKKEFQLG